MGAALISQPGMVGHGGPPGAMGPQGLPPPPPQHYFDPRADVGHQHQLDSLRNRLRNPSTHRSHGGPQGRLPPRRWRGGPQNQPPPPHAHSQTQAAAASFNSVNPYPVITPLVTSLNLLIRVSNNIEFHLLSALTGFVCGVHTWSEPRRRGGSGSSSCGSRCCSSHHSRG